MAEEIAKRALYNIYRRSELISYYKRIIRKTGNSMNYSDFPTAHSKARGNALLVVMAVHRPGSVRALLSRGRGLTMTITMLDYRLRRRFQARSRRLVAAARINLALCAGS